MADIVMLIQRQPDLYVLNGASDDDIQNAERKLGLVFATDYYEYIATFGAASFASHELTGICKSHRLNVVDVTLEEREYANVPKSWYVVEQTNIDGIVIWQAYDGAIYLTAPDRQPSKIADGLVNYILR